MIRMLVLTGLACAAAGLLMIDPSVAQTTALAAQTAPPTIPTEISAQRRERRAPTRLRVYRNQPGPNSKRVCNARYVQEYRPSGTVIVPVVNCYWSG